MSEREHSGLLWPECHSLLPIIPNSLASAVKASDECHRRDRVRSGREYTKEEHVMSAFTIDTENNITAFASLQHIEETAAGTETFSTAEQLAALAAQWPAARLLEVWNSLPGVTPVERFTSRSVAAKRIWKAIQHLQPTPAAQTASKPTRSARPSKQASHPAKPAVGQNTKAAQVIALLRQPAGATLKSIVAATGWQSHSVRGFISGQLGKKLGLQVKSFQRDGERVYRLRP